MPTIFEAITAADGARRAERQDARQARLADLAIRKQDLAETQYTQQRMSEQDALKASTIGGFVGMLPQIPTEQRREALATFLESAEGRGIRFDADDLQGFNETLLPILDDDARLISYARGLGQEVEMPEGPSYNNPMAAVDPTTGEEVFIQAGSDGSVRSVEGFRPRPRSPATQVNVNTGEGGFKVPNGYMLKDPNDPSQGVTPIPGGPQDEMSVGDAGKAQMLRSAQSVLPQIDERLFNKDGSINRYNIANATAGTPLTEGRELDRFYEVGIQAITRLETGAAMPPSDIQNTRARFQPSPLDSDTTIKAKRALYGDFLSGALDLIDPSNRLDRDGNPIPKLNEDAFNNELAVREMVIEGGGGYSPRLSRMITAQEIAEAAANKGISVEEARKLLGIN